jgi:predicted RNA binding protein YcfA (HicA-like mRNA interferase family)
MAGTSIERAAATGNIDNQKKGVVTIAGKRNDDLAPGTQNSILKQAGLK